MASRPLFAMVKENPRRLLIAKEKHGNRIFLVPTNADLQRACQKLYEERLESYHSDEDYGRYLKMAEVGEYYQVLRRRENWEYEGLEFDFLEDYENKN